MNWFSRERMVDKLKENEDWDVLVIGGGATGLGVAVDAVSRGYKTLLVEQEDFAKGTSSRSTKLVHGGVRYLAQGNITLVREALKERGILLKNAPHITRNVSFIIPCYSWFRLFFYAVGLKIYDWLSGKWTLGKSEIISKGEVIKRLPVLRKISLRGGVLYHDGAFDDARLAVNLAQTAVDHGGFVMNYCRINSLLKDDSGKINGAVAEDREARLTYRLKAKVVINATGVFADGILAMDNPEAASIIRPSQGIHLVLDKSFLQSKNAIMIPHTDDCRVLFAIPWHQKVLVGTTDTPLNSHSLEPKALDAEVEFILKNAGSYLSKRPARKDVLCVFAGLRPLAATGDNSEKTKEISRSHKIIISRSGLVTIIGGKWTTYRRMAEDTLDAAIKRGLLTKKECVTENFKIHGFTEKRTAGELGFYGADARAIENMMDADPSLAAPIAPGVPVYGAQVIWAVRHEMARTIEDVLARRTRILFFDAAMAVHVAPEVAELMQKELGYGPEWKEDQIRLFDAVAEKYLLS